MEIHKFGGACTGSRQNIDRIAEIVLEEKLPIIITVSASSGVTTRLVEIMNQNADEIFVPSIIAELQRIHQELRYQQENIEQFEQDLHKLERLLYGIIYTEEITERSRDLVLSFGERLISWIVRERLLEKGIKCEVVDPTELIVTDGIHYNSRILHTETEEKCHQFKLTYNSNIEVIIVPGYFGASKNNVTTLLGRSGTDYSATALANGFNSEAVTIWKDVQGFMTSDPRIVSSAKTINSLSYEEAAELSHFGAVILHPKSVIPAKLKNIPIWIRNFQDRNIYTKIHTLSEKESTIVKSVSHLSNLSIIRVYVATGGHTRGIFSELAKTIDLAGANIYSVATSQTCISILVKSEEVEQSLRFIKDRCMNFVDDIETQNNSSLLCIVGLGLGYTPGVASRVFKAVAKQDVNVEMISSGASKAAYHFTIDTSDLHSALNAVHEEFFS